MNWGKGIALTYVAFVIFMLGLVYMAVSQDFDLVAEDYYEQEIAYQGRIDQLTNAMEDDQNVVVTHVDGAVKLLFAKPARDVKVHFFRPSDDAMDMKLDEAAVDSELSVPITRFSSGKYVVKVQWKSNGTTYFQEDDLFID